ncbi:MAG: hypothetical protein QW478_08385 [Candidatus Micrarchaeaceae archaeon]
MSDTQQSKDYLLRTIQIETEMIRNLVRDVQYLREENEELKNFIKKFYSILNGDDYDT